MYVADVARKEFYEALRALSPAADDKMVIEKTNDSLRQVISRGASMSPTPSILRAA